MNINKPLKDYFSHVTLTGCQSQVLKELEFFLQDDTQIFILKGYAGTGKTFILKGLCQYMQANGRGFGLMAPTGRAAKIIRDKTGFVATTIHSRIYSQEIIKELKPKDKTAPPASETMKVFFKLQINEDNGDTAYLVDESSMVSNSYSDQEYVQFGTGYLLKDLIKYIGFSPSNRRKLIFIGDDAQLPPVNDSFSPAFSPKYLLEEFSLKSREVQMTEVVRQKRESGILHNATILREAIKIQQFNKLSLETSFSDIKLVATPDIFNQYLLACGNEVNEETTIIAYTNEKVQQYNQMVRNHFFPGKVEIASGDRVLIVQNNYSYQTRLYNGQFATVAKTSPTLISRTVSLKGGKEVVKLDFRQIALSLVGETGEKHTLECLMIENLLNSTSRDLSASELNALYVDFKIRHPQLRPNTEAFNMALSQDKYFNCVRLKYGYAITCHKSQGGEWARVFVDFTFSGGLRNSNYFRWAYTAITRASETLYLVNAPRLGLSNDAETIIQASSKSGKLINFHGWENQKQESISYTSALNLEEQIHYKIYGAVTAVLGQGGVSKSNCDQDNNLDNIEIVSIIHHQYCERYILNLGGHEEKVDFYYNSKDEISKVIIHYNPNTTQNLLVELLEPLAGKQLVEKEKVIEFPSDKPFLAEFYYQLKEKLGQTGIEIVSVEHCNYLEKYVFTQHEQLYYFDIYYNGKGKITKFIAKQDKSSSVETIAAISQLIKEV